MKKILILAAALVGLIVTSSNASAGGYANPVNVPQQAHSGVLAKFFRPQPLPAFQAAPWYLYFPYNAHFQMPAPLYGDQMGGGYGAPQMGGGNPYFPNK